MNYLEELYEIEKEYYISIPIENRKQMYEGMKYRRRLQHYIRDNIKRVCDFSECSGDYGVYLIEDIYIGKSIHIRDRIGEHLEESLIDPDSFEEGIDRSYAFKSNNENKVLNIRKILETRKLKITQLSEDVKQENTLIKEGHLKYNLVNRTGLPKT